MASSDTKSAVEEHAAAKAAKAAAEAAEAARKVEAEEGRKALDPITLDVLAAAEDYSAKRSALGDSHLSFGRTLLAAEAVLSQYPALDMSIARYCETTVPDESGPVWGSSPAYRALQAARVAVLVPAGVVMSTDSLRKWHRVIDVPGAVPALVKAAKAKAGRGKPIRGNVAEEVLEDLYPKDESKSPGPAKGTAKPKAVRNTPTAEGPVEVPDHAVSGPRLKSAALRVSEVLGSDDPAPIIVAAAIVKCCEDYGIAATREAVKALAEDGIAQVKAAAKPTTRKARSTRKAS